MSAHVGCCCGPIVAKAPPDSCDSCAVQYPRQVDRLRPSTHAGASSRRTRALRVRSPRRHGRLATTLPSQARPAPPMTTSGGGAGRGEAGPHAFCTGPLGAATSTVDPVAPSQRTCNGVSQPSGRRACVLGQGAQWKGGGDRCVAVRSLAICRRAWCDLSQASAPPTRFVPASADVQGVADFTSLRNELQRSHMSLQSADEHDAYRRPSSYRLNHSQKASEMQRQARVDHATSRIAAQQNRSRATGTSVQDALREDL